MSESKSEGLSSLEPDIKQLNMKRFRETIDEANMLKSLGNDSVKNVKYMEAINYYVDALSICHPVYTMECPQELKEQFKTLNLQLLNNLSFCYFNMRDYNKCISTANQVLFVLLSFRSYWWMSETWRLCTGCLSLMKRKKTLRRLGSISNRPKNMEILQRSRRSMMKSNWATPSIKRKAKNNLNKSTRRCSNKTPPILWISLLLVRPRFPSQHQKVHRII